MTINADKNGDKLTISLSGKLDTSTAPELKNAIEKEAVDINDLTIDMTELSYVSSAGLRVLISAQKKMNSIGTMRLRGVRNNIMEVFEMTGFSGILNIE